MFQRHVRPQRQGYTLLETILAVSIAVVLLGALYVAMDIQVRHAETARDLIEQTTLARALLNRISLDISPSLGTPDPNRFKGSGSSSSGTTGTGTPGTSGTGGSTSTGTDPSTSGQGSGTSSASSSGTGAVLTTTTANVFVLQGDSSNLTLFLTRVPRDSSSGSALEGMASNSDLYRVVYWLPGGEDSPLGLARYELAQVTSDDAALAPPDVTDASSKMILAPEVKSLAFRYFDGTTWQESWDGTSAGPDGTTPIGPPAAVEIVLGLAPRNSTPGPETQLKYYRQVVVIPTANVTVQGSQTSLTTGSTSSTGTTSGNTSP